MPISQQQQQPNLSPKFCWGQLWILNRLVKVSNMYSTINVVKFSNFYKSHHVAIIVVNFSRKGQRETYLYVHPRDSDFHNSNEKSNKNIQSLSNIVRV